jgi:hypothetical protein
MRRARRNALALALVCFALALAITLAAGPGRSVQTGRSSLLERLVGPFAALVASAQWVRADLALREGHFGVFCERAETALTLAPADPQAWIYYAHQLIWERASLEREPERERREGWTRAGIELLERAKHECAHPDEIWVYEGGVFAAWAEMPAEIRPWPGSARELRLQAIEDFGRAHALGHPKAAMFEQWLRERLDEPER